MPVEVVVPEVGEVGMDITFLRWLREEGAEIREGDPLFEVDTAKATLEVEAYADGRLADLRVGEGDLVQPHQVVALLLRPGETPPDAAPPPEHAPAGGSLTPAAPPRPAAAPGRDRQGDAGAGASPRARRRARELDVVLGGLTGSGPSGLVTVGDVEAATPQADRARGGRTRQAVAAITARNWQQIPHIQLSAEVDMTAALQVAKPTVAFLAALCRALEQQPECNLAWRGDDVVRREGVDLGLLVDTPHGLQLPAIRDAGALGLDALATAVRTAAERARARELRGDDVGARSATVSNLGMHAVDGFDGVIAGPDVLLLTTGRVRTVPRWHGSTLAVCKVATCTLALDHRVLDGADGGRLLDRFEAALTDPEVLDGHH